MMSYSKLCAGTGGFMLDYIRKFLRLKKFKHLDSGQQGFGLVESLISVAILGTAGFMLISSLSTGMIAVGIYHERVTAENIARTQMEYTVSPNQIYLEDITSYPADPAIELPHEYSVTIDVIEDFPYMQVIAVRVERRGNQLYRLEGIKLNQ